MSAPRVPKEVQALNRFLKKEQPIDITNLFVVLQLVVEALGTRFRWDKRARAHLSRSSRAKGQQLFRENVFQHCFKTGLLAALMVEVERKAGTADIDTGRLILAGLLHDIPELFRGDNFYWARTGKKAQLEKQAFSRLAQGFPPELRNFLKEIYAITQPPKRGKYHDWTREQRFFKLVELVGYFKRVIAECRAGNLNFAGFFPHHWARKFPHDPRVFLKEFPATLRFWFPEEVRREIDYFRDQATGGVSN